MHMFFELSHSKNEILQPVLAWQAVSNSSDQVQLIASIELALGKPMFPGQAATLAIQMDSQVAIELYKSLGKLGRSEGWLPPEARRPASLARPGSIS